MKPNTPPGSTDNRRWRVVILSSFFILAALLALLPLGIRMGLQYWLLDNGAQAVSIGRVRLNPLTGTASLDGLRVELENQVVLGDDTFHLDLELGSLLRRQAHLKTATLDGLILDIEQNTDGSWRIGSITTAAPPEEQEPAKKTAWLIRASQVELTNCQIRFTANGLRQSVVIENALLRNFFTGNGDQPGSLSLQGRINDTPLHLELDQLSLQPDLRIAGHVSLKGYKLDTLAGLLKQWLSPFQGTITLDGDTQFSLGKEKGMAVGYNGSLTLDAIDIGSEDFSTRTSRFIHQGTIRYQQNNQGVITIVSEGPLQSENLEVGVPAASLNLKEKHLQLDGASAVTIDNGVAVHQDGSFQLQAFHLEMPSMAIKHQGARWKGVVDYTLHGDSHHTIEVSGALGFQSPLYSLANEGFALQTEASGLAYTGRVGLHIPSGTEPLSVRTDGQLKGEGYHLSIAELLDIKEKELLLDGATEFLIGQEISVEHEARELHLTGGELHSRDLTHRSELTGWQGKVAYHLAPDKATVALDGTLLGKALFLQIPGTVELHQEAMQLSGATRVEHRPAISVFHEGKLEAGPAKVKLSTLEMEGQQASWQGTSEYRHDSRTTHLNGSLKAADLHGLLTDQQLQISQDALQLTADGLQFHSGTPVTLAGKGDLEATGLQIDRDQNPLLRTAQVAIHGIGGGEDGRSRIDTITLRNLEAPASPGQPLAASVEEIRLLALESDDPLRGVKAGGLEILKTTVQETRDNTRLMHLESIRGQQLAVEEWNAFSLATLSTGPGSFLHQEGKRRPQISLKGSEAAPINWSRDKGLLVGHITFDSLTAQVSREAGAPAKGAERKEKENKKTEKQPPPIQVGRFTLGGENILRFTDRTTSPEVKTALYLESLEASTIDLRSPETPFPFQIKGTFDKYAPLAISGTCAPYAKEFQLESKTSLRNYPLTQLSPYIAAAIGSAVNDGRLSLQSDLKIKGEALQSENTLLLQQVQTRTVDQGLLSQLNSRLPLPLDIALSILRDSNGDIKLNVPVSGGLSHLSINPTDILITTLSRAITLAAAPYLAYTVLGPTGALTYLGLQLGQSLLKTNLPELTFAPGEMELSEKQIQELDRLGKIIKEDKEQVYSICSSVLLWEAAEEGMERSPDNQQKLLTDSAVRRKLYAIADERAKKIQAYLSGNFSIDQERLLICSPTINVQHDGQSKVKFLK